MNQYAIPLRIKEVSAEEINETMNSIILIYHVDDLAGWYTVDRLSKCGEGAGQYPSNPNNRRRYIKRVNKTSWITGYLFKAYSASESHEGSGSNVQYITINPENNNIHIQQGSYDIQDDRNIVDPIKNKLTIEYIYSDCAGWWTHESMYDRSFNNKI